MTRQFNTDMERDINRIAIATEKILKLLKESLPVVINLPEGTNLTRRKMK